jgi:hypothetical protein
MATVALLPIGICLPVGRGVGAPVVVAVAGGMTVANEESEEIGENEGILFLFCIFPLADLAMLFSVSIQATTSMSLVSATKSTPGNSRLPSPKSAEWVFSCLSPLNPVV